MPSQHQARSAGQMLRLNTTLQCWASRKHPAVLGCSSRLHSGAACVSTEARPLGTRGRKQAWQWMPLRSLPVRNMQTLRTPQQKATQQARKRPSTETHATLSDPTSLVTQRSSCLILKLQLWLQLDPLSPTPHALHSNLDCFKCAPPLLAQTCHCT